MLNTSNLQPESSVESKVNELVRVSSYKAELRHETKDVLKQLSANVASLEDLSGRLSFMMSELRSLIKHR